MNTPRAGGILGVNRNATSKNIEKAFRRRALQLHPDKGGNPEEFKLLGQAREYLTTPTDRDRRVKYSRNNRRNNSRRRPEYLFTPRNYNWRDFFPHLSQNEYNMLRAVQKLIGKSIGYPMNRGIPVSASIDRKMIDLLDRSKKGGRWNIEAAVTLYMKERKGKRERDAFRFAKMNKDRDERERKKECDELRDTVCLAGGAGAGGYLATTVGGLTCPVFTCGAVTGGILAKKASNAYKKSMENPPRARNMNRGGRRKTKKRRKRKTRRKRRKRTHKKKKK